MPYIKQEDRDRIDTGINALATPTTPGELNYMITRICHAYMRWHGVNYTHFNDVIGALESTKLELYRKEIAPYENKKIEENGDVKI